MPHCNVVLACIEHAWAWSRCGLCFRPDVTHVAQCHGISFVRRVLAVTPWNITRSKLCQYYTINLSVCCNFSQKLRCCLAALVKQMENQNYEYRVSQPCIMQHFSVHHPKQPMHSVMISVFWWTIVHDISHDVV
jgi:hypothetical protein